MDSTDLRKSVNGDSDSQSEISTSSWRNNANPATVDVTSSNDAVGKSVGHFVARDCVANESTEYAHSHPDISAAVTLLDADTSPVVISLFSSDGLVHSTTSSCNDDEGEFTVLITSRNLDGSPHDVEIKFALDPFTTNTITMNGRTSVSRTIVSSLIISRHILIIMSCLVVMLLMS